MTIRTLRSILALGAVFALTLALAGGAFAHGKDDGKPEDNHSGVHVDKPGSGKKPYSLTQIKSKNGTTTLTIDAGLKTALDGLAVTVSGLPPASGSFDFPVTKARVIVKQPKSGKDKRRGRSSTRRASTRINGFVNHSGGLKFAKGALSATLSNLRIDFSSGKHGTLSGNVNGAGRRVRLGTLADVAYDAVSRDITVGKVTLTRKAADTLNSALGIGTVLTKTTVLGSLKVDTTP